MSIPGWGPAGKASGTKNTGLKQINMPTFNGGQQDLFSLLLGGSRDGVSKGLSHLGNLASGNEETFNQLEAPAFRQFAGLQGNLASRFSGMGSGARNSSGFQNTAREQAGDFAERLSGQRLSMQNDAIAQLLGLSEQLLNKKTFESGYAPKKRSGWQTLLGGLGGVGGAGAGAFGGNALFKLLGM